MTFEEFWQSRYSLPICPRCTRSEAEIIWNAAKEDSKPAVKTVFVECFHGGVDFSYYKLVGLKANDRVWHFTYEFQAQQWAIENGYRIAEEE